MTKLTRKRLSDGFSRSTLKKKMHSRTVNLRTTNYERKKNIVFEIEVGTVKSFFLSAQRRVFVCWVKYCAHCKLERRNSRILGDQSRPATRQSHFFSFMDFSHDNLSSDQALFETEKS